MNSRSPVKIVIYKHAHQQTMWDDPNCTKALIYQRVLWKSLSRLFEKKDALHFPVFIHLLLHDFPRISGNSEQIKYITDHGTSNTLF